VIVVLLHCVWSIWSYVSRVARVAYVLTIRIKRFVNVERSSLVSCLRVLEGVRSVAQLRSPKPTYRNESGIQTPNSLPGANRESSCRLRYVQY